MNSDTELHDGLKKVLGKLYSLRDSCWGVIICQRYPRDFEWFEAAAGICQEAEDRIREAGRFLAESKGES
jgi:hypothetical protein